NRSAIGAQVRVKLRSRTLTQQVEAGTGEGNQNDSKLHFGLRTQSRPVTVEITWPGGQTQTLRNVPVDQILTVKQPAAR
ncbi:MAG: ASPIC/UnbV domain-containing protein, partial [Armatimonadota bacterium]